MADILPEGLKAAGAEGVVVNHCEKPMSLPAIKATIDRANELDMLVFACADTVAEAKAIAQLGPDIINPEPTELIGGSGGGVSDMGYVKEVIFPKVGKGETGDNTFGVSSHHSFKSHLDASKIITEFINETYGYEVKRDALTFEQFESIIEKK